VDLQEGNGYSEKTRPTAKASKSYATKGTKDTKDTKESKKGTKSKKGEAEGEMEDETEDAAEDETEDEEPARPLPDSRPLTSISLGSVRPEGIVAVFDDYMLTSEFAFGGIKRVNILTGRISQVVPPYEFMERGALGLEYYDGHLLVAGGGLDPKLFVYNVETGTEVAACATRNETSFLNDVAIVGNYAYVTDSFNSVIMVVDVASALLLGVCKVQFIELPAELFQRQDEEYLASGTSQVTYST
jgi:hypothetical protein